METIIKKVENEQLNNEVIIEAGEMAIGPDRGIDLYKQLAVSGKTAALPIFPLQKQKGQSVLAGRLFKVDGSLRVPVSQQHRGSHSVSMAFIQTSPR